MKMRCMVGLLLVAPSLAQQAIWQQCGGAQWTGGTTCVAGTTCQVQNEWYSQCLPAPAQASSSSSSSSSASSSISTTSTTTTTTTITTTTSTSPSIQPTTLTTTFTTAIGKKTSSSLPPCQPTAVSLTSQTSGMQFVVDGKHGYFTGTNAYWIAFLTNNADIDGVFTQLQRSGLKILRIWGFNTVNSIPTDGSVYFQALVPGQSPIINKGADGLQRLDYVVQSARAHGIKLIINFTNNWSDYGGIPAYNSYYGTSSQTWYTNSAAQVTYRNYIQAVVSRYANNPAIFAWELANEPRCTGCTTSTLTSWISTTSTFIKTLDKAHLVGIGDEGFGLTGGDGSYPFSTAEGLDFAANLALSTIDYGTLHMYPAAWGESSNANFAAQWIAAHGAACVAAGKPCLLEEYGTGASAPSAGVNTLPAHNVSLEQSWQQSILATRGFGGDLFWDLGTVLADGMRTWNDGNTVYTDDTNAWNALVVQHGVDVRRKNGF